MIVLVFESTTVGQDFCVYDASHVTTVAVIGKIIVIISIIITMIQIVKNITRFRIVRADRMQAILSFNV